MMQLVPITPQPIANVENEFLLLSNLLFDPRKIDGIADKLQPEDFAEPFLGRVYSIIVAEHARGSSLTVLTLRPYIENDPGYIELGREKFLSSLNTISAGIVNSGMAAKQIEELARRRRFVAGLQDALVVGSDMSAPIEEGVDSADAAISEALTYRDTISQISAAQALQTLIASADKPKRSVMSHIIPSMDELLGGMRPKQLIIGAGRPGMGKTAAALSYALGAAQAGHGVLFVSLEMSATELAARMAADMSFDGRGGAPYADINSDNPSHNAIRAMVKAQAALADMPFQIVDAGSLTLTRLDMMVRRWKRRYAARGESLDLVVIDYLQLLRCDDKRTSAYEAVSEISRRIKGMAKDHDVAVFALAQLNRSVEQRPDKRPQLSDLRDSGQIEQDADAVLFLYRHEYYVQQELRAAEPGSAKEIDARAALSACEGAIDFICAKRRNGVTGSAIGQFHGAYQAVRG